MSTNYDLFICLVVTARYSKSLLKRLYSILKASIKYLQYYFSQSTSFPLMKSLHICFYSAFVYIQLSFVPLSTDDHIWSVILNVKNIFFSDFNYVFQNRLQIFITFQNIYYISIYLGELFELSYSLYLWSYFEKRLDKEVLILIVINQFQNLLQQSYLYVMSNIFKTFFVYLFFHDHVYLFLFMYYHFSHLLQNLN